MAPFDRWNTININLVRPILSYMWGPLRKFGHVPKISEQSMF